MACAGDALPDDRVWKVNYNTIQNYRQSTVSVTHGMRGAYRRNALGTEYNPVHANRLSIQI